MMELWQEMLGGLTEEERREFVVQIKALLELRCYRALDEIRTILRDDTLSDSACFEKIEEIVCAMERIGSNGGGRHDFG